MLIHDHFQNFKVYQIPKAQLIIADIPYNLGNNAYASNPAWYKDGDNKNGESKLAGKTFFDTDVDFRIPEFLHFCSKMLKPEPKERGKAPCMIVFCSFELLREINFFRKRIVFHIRIVKASRGQIVCASLQDHFFDSNRFVRLAAVSFL